MVDTKRSQRAPTSELKVSQRTSSRKSSEPSGNGLGNLIMVVSSVIRILDHENLLKREALSVEIGLQRPKEPPQAQPGDKNGLQSITVPNRHPQCHCIYIRGGPGPFATALHPYVMRFNS